MRGDKKEKRFKLYSQLALIGIVVTVFWIILAPFWLTGQHNIYDMVNTGQIGDTIGGITAPAVGLLSSILIYLSFRAQIYANERIEDQIDVSLQQSNFDYLLDKIKDIDEKIKKFRFISGTVYASGPKAIISFNHYVQNEIQIDLVDRDETQKQCYKLDLLLFELLTYTNHIIRELNLSPEHKLILGTNAFVYYEETIKNSIQVTVATNASDAFSNSIDSKSKVDEILNKERQINVNMLLFEDWIHGRQQP